MLYSHTTDRAYAISSNPLPSLGLGVLSCQDHGVDPKSPARENVPELDSDGARVNSPDSEVNEKNQISFHPVCSWLVIVIIIVCSP